MRNFNTVLRRAERTEESLRSIIHISLALIFGLVTLSQRTRAERQSGVSVCGGGDRERKREKAKDRQRKTKYTT